MQQGSLQLPHLSVVLRSRLEGQMWQRFLISAVQFFCSLGSLFLSIWYELVAPYVAQSFDVDMKPDNVGSHKPSAACGSCLLLM